MVDSTITTPHLKCDKGRRCQQYQCIISGLNEHFCVILLLLHVKLNFRLLYFFCFNFRTRSPDGKSHLVNSSSSGRVSPFPQEDLSSVGFVEEPDLVDLCDMSGHIWVHERCAAWTLASIATKSSADYTVDLTNQILSKVNSSTLLFVMSVNL